jgi:hypothetical protein
MRRIGYVVVLGIALTAESSAVLADSQDQRREDKIHHIEDVVLRPKVGLPTTRESQPSHSATNTPPQMPGGALPAPMGIRPPPPATASASGH